MICAMIGMNLQFFKLSKKQPISKGCVCMTPFIRHSIIQISGCQELGMGVGAEKRDGCGYKVDEGTWFLSIPSLQLPMDL